MSMYPGHTLLNVLDMYAVSFFSLLEHGFKLRYSEYRIQATISLLGYMKKHDRVEFLRELERAATDSDMLYNESTEDGMEKLKRIFEGK